MKLGSRIFVLSSLPSWGLIRVDWPQQTFSFLSSKFSEQKTFLSIYLYWGCSEVWLLFKPKDFKIHQKIQDSPKDSPMRTTQKTAAASASNTY
jgi:hypothetical protein